MTSFHFLPKQGSSTVRAMREKMCRGGGVSINRKKMDNPQSVIDKTFLLHDTYILVQKGKKNYFLVKSKLTRIFSENRVSCYHSAVLHILIAIPCFRFIRMYIPAALPCRLILVARPFTISLSTTCPCLSINRNSSLAKITARNKTIAVRTTGLEK